MSGERGYEAFAADYHWLLDDEQLEGEAFLRPYADVLAQLPDGARVLDAACGIGVEATALARRGLRVSATDASPAMVEQAVLRLDAARSGVTPEVVAWSDLPSRFGPEFDLVVCNGNSLVHAGDHGSAVAALRGMRGVLRRGGRVVVGTRDFEVLRRSRPDVEVARRAVTRDGVRAVCVYTWVIPRRWTQRHEAHVHLLLDDGIRLDHRRHVVSFVPYRASELVARVREAGLTVERSDRTGAAARYTLVLTASSADRAGPGRPRTRP